MSSHVSKQKLLGRDFLLLFCMSLCANSFFAVFYCFEQWLEGMAVSPNWRGMLLAALFVMVMFFRPVVSVWLLRRSKAFPLAASILVSGLVMLAYPCVPSGPDCIGVVLVLRLLQGIALAVYSSCVVSVLVQCIPEGESARGFALFSLTNLLPYAIIPAISERLLPLVGGVPQLFAITSTLALPALGMLTFLAPRLRTRQAGNAEALPAGRALRDALFHSDLFFIYLACLLFGTVTMQAVAFIKGLCAVTGSHPSQFFAVYATVIIVVRMFGSHRLDVLPRYRVSVLSCVLLAVSALGMAWGPLWSFIGFTVLYGLGLSLLYPMLASLIYDRSTPETRPLNSNLMMAAFDASGIIAPLLGGMIIDVGFGYRGVFVFMAATILLSAGCTLYDRQRHQG